MLDANATSQSKRRWQHAHTIAAACPENLFDEIALTGSSARGIATANSDVEINFWVAKLPSYAERRAWVASLGVEHVTAQKNPRPDNSYWVNGVYKNIELEAGWQTFSALDNALTPIIKAQTTDHKALRLAELVLNAKNLRGSGALYHWQPILQNYPSELSHKLIEDALNHWLMPDWVQNRFSKKTFRNDIHRVWRLIFALNHQWEVNWKHAHHNLPMLEQYPKNIAKRIWEIQATDTQQAKVPMLQLIVDTLELVKIHHQNKTQASELFRDFAALLDQAKNNPI